MVAIAGPSGCGKSTLLNMISGIDSPTEGTIIIDGTEINRLDDDARTLIRRDAIGLVFQFFNLLPTLTACENVALPLTLAGRSRYDSRERAGELLRMVGLESRLDHLPDELSGGEQQRVAIARALARQPALVLADEPTGNLDSENARQILSLLQALARESQTTVIVATHDREAATFCGRVVKMKDGQITDD